MTIASLSPQLKSAPQFIIYAFEKDEVSKGSPVWQTHKILSNENDACREAEELFAKQKFTRVEVRRKGDDEVIKICDVQPPFLRKYYLMFSGAAFCIVSAALITIYQ